MNPSQLDSLRQRWRHGENLTQDELRAVVEELTPFHERGQVPFPDGLRLHDKAESLPLFDRTGSSLDLAAPRWLCHVLALRHRCAHLLLTWTSPVVGEMIVLQIRDWDKDSSPGRLDISVGGHMTATGSGQGEDTAFDEMLEELGLHPADITAPERVGGYPYDEVRPGDSFFNSEWRDVYLARLNADSIGKVEFTDGEVAGLVLLPLRGAQRLLEQVTVPMASALTESLPMCLEHMGTDG